MLVSILFLLLISNALTLRKDKSILFSRVVMITLNHTSFLAYNNIHFLSLGILYLAQLFFWLFSTIIVSFEELFSLANITPQKYYSWKL